MKNMIKIFAIAIAIVMMSSFAMAGPILNSDIALGASSKGTGDSTVAQITPEAGNITEQNISNVGQTGSWAAFYGDVSSMLQLADASDNVLYNGWAAGADFDWVFMANSSSVGWATIQANDIRAAEDTALGLAGSDTVANTFTAPTAGTHNAITVQGAAPLGVDVASTVSTNGGFTTALLTDAAGNAIYGGQVEASKPNYAGNNVEYQMMIPTDGSRVYYVYALIN